MTGHNSRAAPDPSASRIVVECVGLGRTYGTGAAAVTAVAEVSFALPTSARVALVGPSGSGKTTLLHLIAGLDTPTTGTVRWPALRDIRRGRAAKVGVVFQGPSLLPALDVTENVALPLLFAGKSADQAMQHAGIAITLLQIGELADRLPDELSGGQAQRAAIARVLAARPKLILADEPTGQLDHDTAARTIAVLLDTADAIDAAVIIATHDPAVADRLTTRWTMCDGRLDTGSAVTGPGAGVAAGAIDIGGDTP
ncbi:ABC transporter ATP-binding protein [Rhodococcus qingshengii]|uniref:ABC transporter ATP-binding protein n=1 Tax=Rhodococcus qingshengii TaxID=334542 RepID=UPI000A0B6F2E|nr:ATP-binding cassette domain-containing protein [Rhodococcus qingshengii]ORC22388.1 ABC transporter ATP-binding protein [Rhodococcus qingshengii]